MELIDTPNPDAKKILFDQTNEDLLKTLEGVEGVSSVFFWTRFYNNYKRKQL